MSDTPQSGPIWGSHEHKLDAKGRLSIPSEIRANLGLDENDVLIVTRHAAKRCLLVFWETAWKAFEAKAQQLAEGRATALWARLEAGEVETGGAVEEAAEHLMRKYHRRVKLDRLGRIQLPAMLRGYAGIKGGDPCLILGEGGAISVWSEEHASAEHDESNFAGQKHKVTMLISATAASSGGSGE